MTNLATAAARIGRKPTKAIAQQIVKELAQAHPESAHDLALLYTYFMPPRPSAKAAENGFAWVAQAAAVKDRREYLKFVHVTAETMTGTDGNRIHRLPNDEGREPGYYCPRTGDYVHGLGWQRFPDVERVIPRLNLMDFPVERLAELDVEELGTTPYYMLPVYQNRRIAIPKVQLEQALAGHDGGFTVRQTRDECSPVKIELTDGADDRLIVIVPAWQR